LIETLSQKRYGNSKNLLAQDDRLVSSAFRLVQLIELGAKSASYKKTKMGGKLAMRDVAE
jgi:hypothetical protein